MVYKIAPLVWGVVLSEQVNSPPIFHQAPGVGGRAYQKSSSLEDWTLLIVHSFCFVQVVYDLIIPSVPPKTTDPNNMFVVFRSTTR